MANLMETLKISTGKGEEFNFSLNESYNEVFNLRQEVDNSNGFIKLVGSSSTISAQNLQDVKSMVIKNNGRVASEIQFQVTEYKDNSNVDDANSVDLGPGSATTTRQVSFLLSAGEYIFMPNVRWVAYAEDASAANAAPTTSGTYLTLDSNEYVDSTGDLDSATADGVVNSTSATTVYLEPYTDAANCAANLFHVGDLIRIRDEIMEVTAIGDKSNLANNYLTVIRGVKGSTATTNNADDDPIRLPFFNAYEDYNTHTVVQTNHTGRFRATNFFGFGRVQDSTSDGIVPGSIAGKFYLRGYQALGLSGITAGTSTGLSTSTTYYFTIAADGGSTIEISFTTDSSNVNFGGNNGVIRKIQEALDAQFYVEGNLLEKKVHVGIVDGDIRFTSGQYLSTSAIALTAGTSGGSNTTNLFDGSNPIARIPAAPNGAVAAKLPSDTIINSSGVSTPNVGSFFYDDGHGGIHGTAQGTVNYTTGAIDFTGPPNAEFAITANYHSAHSGGANSTSASENVIIEIGARSCNSKINCPIEIVAFN